MDDVIGGFSNGQRRTDMFRSVLAVIAGYVAMFVLVFAMFSMAYLLMGADRAFKPGSYQVTALWAVVSFVLGLLAAVVGGVVCAVLARRSRPPLALAALVLVLGLLMAVPVATAPKPTSQPARTAAVGNFEAMRQARQPVWVALVNPFLGAAGVLLGARVGRRYKPPASA